MSLPDLSNKKERKQGKFQGVITTPFDSIERFDYTSFDIRMQDKKVLFSDFPAGVVTRRQSR